jgi:hypothetical protein
MEMPVGAEDGHRFVFGKSTGRFEADAGLARTNAQILIRGERRSELGGDGARRQAIEIDEHLADARRDLRRRVHVMRLEHDLLMREKAMRHPIGQL